MKFATHVVLFGQDKWIMKNIANAYPHVDKIYIAYSDVPWTYNPQARLKYKNSFDLNIIRSSPFMDKVVIIEGVWDTEEQQRNACVDAANKDGMDYLIVHDADEFYFHEDFEKLKKFIDNNPSYDYYRVPWYCFWKSMKYILLDADGNEIVGYPEFAINLKRGVRFQAKRRPTHTNAINTPVEAGICYHASYVLTNEELLTKINTWGHVNDFNKERWYAEKWIGWHENMRDLHLVSPKAWSRARYFDKKLPEVLYDSN